MPETLGAFVALLLLVAPGLTFEALRERARPNRNLSPFREVANIVLSSIAFGAISLSLLWIQQRGGDHRLPDLEQLAINREVYVQRNFDLVVAGVSAQVVLSCLVGALWHFLLLCLRPGGYYSQNDAWHELLHGTANPRNGRPFATIELLDGTRWRGFVKGVDRGAEGGVTSFALGRGSTTPLAYQRPGREELISVDEPWAYTVFASGQIRSVTVSYVTSNDP